MVAHTTDDILRALDASPDGPVQFEDSRTHARYVLIPQETYQRVQPLIGPAARDNGGAPIQWSDAKNDRRCDLVDKKIEGTLSSDEEVELAGLQDELLRYRRRVAPLPLEDARELHRELLRKAALAEGRAG